MPNFIMVVMTRPTEGRDAEYNEWYDNTHLAEICAIPGMGSGQRWNARSDLSPNPPPAPYLAIYEIEAEDASSVMGEMMRKAEAGEMDMSDALDLETATMWLYEKH